MAGYIELNAFMKVKGLASSGGQAKIAIREGKVQVNGRPETQNRKKLVNGDTVEFEGKRYVIGKDLMIKPGKG